MVLHIFYNIPVYFSCNQENEKRQLFPAAGGSITLFQQAGVSSDISI